MQEKLVRRVEKAKQVFDNKGITYREYANGQLQVGTVNFWATSEKWYDTENGAKGAGLDSYIGYISGKEETRNQAVSETKETNIQDNTTNPLNIDIDDDGLPW